jgi:hypothetical protein
VTEIRPDPKNPQKMIKNEKEKVTDEVIKEHILKNETKSQVA